MKTHILLTTIVLFSLSSVPVSFAQTVSSDTPTTTQTNPVLTQAAGRKETAASNAAERKEQRQETTMQNLQARALREIDRRVESMSGLISRINNLKRLSDAQKTALVAQVQTEITNLTNLKTKIQADTDITTLRTDVKSIVASYRIYALFVPKIHILAASESMLSATAKLSSAYTDLNERVDSATVAGVDTTAMKTSLATLQAKITDANTQLNNAIATVSALTPEGYPANAAGLKTARDYLTAARKDIVDAFNAAKDILHQLRQSTKSVTHTSGVTPAESTQPTSSTSTLPTNH